MSFTFPGKLGSRMRARMKSSTSFIPCASGMATTSYLSKAARIAGMAGSGVGSEAVGFVCWVWLAAGSTAIRDNSMIQPKRTIRKLRSLAEPKMDMKVRTSQENSTPKSVEASRAVEISDFTQKPLDVHEWLRWIDSEIGNGWGCGRSLLRVRQ